MINTRKVSQKELDCYGFSKIKSFLNPESAKYLKGLIVKEYDIINKNRTFKYSGAPERDIINNLIYTKYTSKWCLRLVTD